MAASGEKRRKPLSAPVRDLLAFLVGKCAISMDLIAKICSKFEPFPDSVLSFKNSHFLSLKLTLYFWKTYDLSLQSAPEEDVVDDCSATIEDVSITHKDQFSF